MKIISGGQTGADIGAIIAAHALKFSTGGTMPLGFKTQAGDKPEYAALYGMTEHSSDKYPPRTFQNVKDGDATVRIAVNFDSPGEKLTLTAIEKYKKPHFDVLVKDTSEFSIESANSPITLAKWIMDNKFTVVNFAGNSERTAPGIENYVIRYVTAVLKEIHE